METMTIQEQELWSRIQGFVLDEPAAEMSFLQRLARDNNWPGAYAQQVADEYRRFIFLACVSGTQLTPSDPVDQAWHLHLTYTKSYWQDLCRDTLNRELHHNPTKGGTDEQAKFEDCYGETFRLYAEKFGAAPPAQVWPNARTRFSDIDFVRTNRRQHWVIAKPRLDKSSGWVSAVLFGVPIASGWLFGAAVAVALLVAFLILFLMSLAKKPGKKTGGKADASGDSGFFWVFDSGGDHHNGDCHGGDSDGGGGDSGCGSGCGGGCSS